MKTISKTTFRDQPAANNAYIGAQIKFDECLKRLLEVRKSMPDCQNWAHAEGACHDVNALVDLTNRLSESLT